MRTLYHLRVPPAKYIWFNYRGSAKQKELSFSLTVEQVAALISQLCTYCGRPPSQRISPARQLQLPQRHSIFRYTGIDRIDSSLGYVEGNVVPCCKSCNEMKSDKTAEEFLALVEAVHEHQNK